MLEEKIREALLGPCAVREGERVLVAVSGGADSVALLHALCRLAGGCRLDVTAAHFEHGIRGEESLGDAQFVRALCAKYHVRLFEGHADVPGLARRWKTGLEDAARRARYAFFRDTAAAAKIETVVLAHHMQDQAETILLNAVRGSAGRGAGAMRERNGLYARPMLGIGRKEILAYLNGNGFSWREDSTNRSLEPARNRVRHAVMPVLRSINPRADEALCRMARMSRRDEAYFEETLERLGLQDLIRTPYGGCTRLANLRGLHPALLSRALHRYVLEVGVHNPSYDCLRHLEDAIRIGGSCALVDGFEAHVGWTHLHLIQREHAPQPFEIPLDAALQGAAFPGGALTPCPFTGDRGDGLRRQAFDARALDGAVVRIRRPGDLFRPLGAVGTQKFKQTLIDRRLDRPFRDIMPLVARGNRVLWAIGLRMGQEAALTTGTKDAVMITFSGALPWL